MARILVVDDEPVIRDLVRETLKFGVHEVEFAADGASALEIASQVLFDLVLLDLCLEGALDGLEVCRRLNEQPVPPKVILVTGNHHDHMRTAGIRAGASAYLTKPFSPLALISEVEAMLEPFDG